MSYQTIITKQQSDVAIITLNRPESANALNQSMAEELTAAMLAADKNAELRAIILTGAGDKAFCAGADLKERKGMNEQQWHAQHAAFEKAVTAILGCRKPVIAAMNGTAFGGGLELAMACDFIYAADSAKMGLTEARLGIMPGMGGTQLLPRAIGINRAKEMLFLGEPISAGQALALGLVNRVLPPASLLPETIATALAIAKNAPLSIAAIKRAVNEGIAQSLTEAMQTELRHYNGLLATKDRHEGINAFNEKRKATFTGE